MSNFMKIGELAKQTGLSIRTLHYYDEIGLLSPSHRTEVGYRLYSNQDIIRLQQIVSLRQLGFSLREIHECLENPAFSLPQVIDLHRARVQEQIVLSHTLLNRLNAIATELQITQSIAVETLIQTMETITMSEQYFTAETFNHFTPEANQVFVLGEDAVRQLKLDFYGTEGILLGLLKERTGIAARVLTASGVNFEAVQQLIEQWIGHLAVNPAEIPSKMPFTPRAYRVFELAVEQAKQLGQAHVDTGHLLLGILKEGEEAPGGLAIRVLKEGLGINLAHLEQQLRSAMSE